MKYLGYLFVAVLVVACSVPFVQSQTNVGLNIKLYAGLSVTGEVGRVYQVQYATELSETNSWYALQHFELKWNPHEFVDTTCPIAEKRFYRAVEVEVPTNLVPVANMVFIPPGVFLMGSPMDEPARWDNEGPQTEVTISRGFWMGAYEVTQEEYLAVMGSNPNFWRNEPMLGGAGPWSWGSGGPVTNELAHPVDSVGWDSAVIYCAILTQQERIAGRLPQGWEYRLPTEAEWEYACRAGTKTAFAYGAALRSGMANFDGRYEYPPCGGGEYSCDNPDGEYLGRTAEVGSYLPNAWGLYDMHGNVWEWCLDWWVDSLPGGRVTDPKGPMTGSYRVVRGGFWLDAPNWVDWGGGARGCRSAFRKGSSGWDWGTAVFGFRVVLGHPYPLE